VFGVAFEIPLFVVLLNLAGVISGRALGAHRPWIIVGTFVFAAVATPSTDPFSMVMLALPMVLLFAISEVIARLVDRRRARAGNALAELDDDEISPLDDGDSDDYRPSSLREEDD
jgi:sec-independent protein translocase protein TatC